MDSLMLKKIITSAALSLLYATQVHAFDDTMRYSSIIKMGKMAKIEAAGMLGAFAAQERPYCKDQLAGVRFDDQEIIRLTNAYTSNAKTDEDRQKGFVILGAYYEVLGNGNRNWLTRECMSLHATAANFSLVSLLRPSDAERKELQMYSILDNNNCFYDGKLPSEKENLWKLIAYPRYEYLQSTREGGYDISEEAYGLGTDDDYDCAELGYFGQQLELAE